MTGPLVSVLVCSKGRPTLQAALDSVAAQQYPKIEVIVVASGGPGHPELPRRCGAFPLALIGSDQPLSRAEAANTALDVAHGDYCVFLGDDERHNPDHVAELIAALQTVPGARLAYSGTLILDSDDEERGANAQPWDRLRLHESNYIHMGAALFDRRLVSEGCRFDPATEPHDDWDFWLQCSEHTDFAFCNLNSTNRRLQVGTGNAAADAASRALVREKWAAVREGLGARFAALVESGLKNRRSSALPQAERDFAAALRINALHPEVLDHHAGLLYARHDRAGAMADLRLALWANPERDAIARKLARLEFESGNPRGAEKLLEAILRRNPQDFETTTMLVRMRTPPVS